MYESPNSLEDLCLDTICDNILIYVKLDHTNAGKRYKFADPDLFLFKELSEKLLGKFLEKNILCDALMFIFSEKNTKLSTVKLKNCKVTQNGLEILKQHKILDLECVNLKNVCIGNIIDCLNEHSIRNMTNVNFAKCSFIDVQRHSLMVKITQFKNLRSLNLAYTELNQHCLNMICEDLKLLEKLDISGTGTGIKDLSPLRQLLNLTSLAISDLSQSANYVSTLTHLSTLRHLDVSVFNEKLDHLTTSNVVKLLDDVTTLPHLVSLDVSGWRDFIPTETLLKYVETHPKLEFLGIVLTDCTFDSLFSSTNQWPNLTIAGLGNENQIKVTLKKYRERSNYVQKALYHLFQLTNLSPDARPDMFNLVLPVMAAHSNKFGVQMAATACLYNLTRGDLSKKIHPKSLSRGVNLTLYAMECFPDEFQLQKNSLLTLCSDTILQEINFDRFRCAKLVLDALCTFEDVNMNRMAVAICSILAAKVSTEETSELGARPVYMRKLLAMVQNRVESGVSDITLKFTLSALWNLTDESAATCTVFLEQGGAYLFLKVLKTFKDDSAIETKVLGLLNNIAEVVKLRHSLMMDPLMNELFVLLKSENIDVSYFAAGIVAHLASDGAEQWTVGSHTREEMLGELKNAVSQWKVPDSEMVAYRSFRPFFSLLRIEMDYQVQLWAVWAIHHVCTKNPKRYCVMLQDENGHLLLSDLINYTDSHPDIKSISSQILETVAGHV
ncbi:protein zyg-11 homolog isoform X1 [Tribolium castaneum]|uniref:Protein zer-1 homolog-like Protein n=1 Tax=Tribolium castaneum TaxID=7070 RepID=D2A447_TRICA|nr:PREDICTED: protein zyg-11 homolog isoform X1 [Tribolium castaneum]EFA05616.1 Protein zer-1 homolog-like Protein [Tribolium castaneum]|eukprot:XP_968834.1 PREDICTED: protein zyg-11 homolog isoform X1 [Tribolium castaneum]